MNILLYESACDSKLLYRYESKQVSNNFTSRLYRPEYLTKEWSRVFAEVLSDHLLAESFTSYQELGRGTWTLIQELSVPEVRDTEFRISESPQNTNINIDIDTNINNAVNAHSALRV